MSTTKFAKTLIGSSIPYYPFKGIERFYDMGGLLNNTLAFAACTCALRSMIKYYFPKATKIGLLDARGFLFSSVSHAPGHKMLPAVMVRKLGKMPNTVSSGDYETEYGHRDGVAVQRHAVGLGDKIVLIDDLVATGGTFGAAIEAVRKAGGEVIGCISLVELDAFAEQRAKVLPDDVPRVALFKSESELLQMGSWKADLPDDYVDDGAVFESKGSMRKV
jgi:adenine phosphoribosyltransferase